MYLSKWPDFFATYETPTGRAMGYGTVVSCRVVSCRASTQQAANPSSGICWWTTFTSDGKG